MNSNMCQSLTRTILLMRDELVESASDCALLSALTETRVALVADANNLKNHAAQLCFATTAMLMARSGHKVYLVAPDVKLVDEIPGLQASRLISSLVAVGRDLLPGAEFEVGVPVHSADLEVRLGDSRSKVPAARHIVASSTQWSAVLRSSGTELPRITASWPFGALTCAALLTVEAFKAAMHKLLGLAVNRDHFLARFAKINNLDFELAPTNSPMPTNLRRFDIISAGAITNTVLYSLASIPKAEGIARVMDSDTAELSNLNRYVLLFRSMVGELKTTTLSSTDLAGLSIVGLPLRFDTKAANLVAPLSPYVLVGADDIPTRWAVQKAAPRWLGIGATTHWSAMASFHQADIGCAGCLHPTNDALVGQIPTAAFVSFWAGLLLASYFVRAVGGETLSVDAQQTYLTSLRPELPWYAPVSMRIDCPAKPHRITENL